MQDANIKIGLEITDVKNVNFLLDRKLKDANATIQETQSLNEKQYKQIVEERNKQPFFSIEDLQQRGKVSQTLIDKMRIMGMLNDMPETSQLSLF